MDCCKGEDMETGSAGGFLVIYFEVYFEVEVNVGQGRGLGDR